MKALKFLLTIAQWVLGVSFLIFAFANGFHWTSILLVIAAVLMMPIKPIRNALRKLKIKSGIAVLLSVVLLFTGITCAPTPETIDNDENSSSYSEEHADNEKNHTTNKTEIPTNKIENNEPSTHSKTQTATGKVTASNSIGAGKNNPIPSNQLPSYSGKPYVTLNKNIPNFSAAELTTQAYEKYSPLDSLGRCGAALASCGKEIMPKDGEKRGSISSIKPSGWVQAKYEGVSGGYLWNRCHLLGWQLSAENANRKNLITGTRYMNTEGMLPFENMIADYINETGNHVAFRVTPIYKGNNLVCSGVQMEAYSVEDNGDGICFNVYCFNVQPGIKINYATGESQSESDTKKTTSTTKKSTTTKKTTTTTKKVTTTTKKVTTTTKKVTTTKKTTTTNNANLSTYQYILNTNSMKFHYPSCGSAAKISPKNYAESNSSRDTLIARGYSPCGNCDP